MKEKTKVLIIIDPQVDFIVGSLKVDDAIIKMNDLANFLSLNNLNYTDIIVTQDHHPLNHCSFKSQGGPWPQHCVSGTPGENIWTRVKEKLDILKDKINIHYLLKGCSPDEEEYSAFTDKNKDVFEEILKNAVFIDVCGIVGTVCVQNSLNDIVKFLGEDSRTDINVFLEFTAQFSENDETKFIDWCNSKNILCI